MALNGYILTLVLLGPGVAYDIIEENKREVIKKKYILNRDALVQMFKDNNVQGILYMEYLEHSTWINRHKQLV